MRRNLIKKRIAVWFAIVMIGCLTACGEKGNNIADDTANEEVEVSAAVSELFDMTDAAQIEEELAAADADPNGAVVAIGLSINPQFYITYQFFYHRIEKVRIEAKNDDAKKVLSRLDKRIKKDSFYDNVDINTSSSYSMILLTGGGDKDVPLNETIQKLVEVIGDMGYLDNKNEVTLTVEVLSVNAYADEEDKRLVIENSKGTENVIADALQECGFSGTVNKYNREMDDSQKYHVYKEEITIEGNIYIICQTCGGEAYITCEGCNGTGSMDCSFCHGTGMDPFDHHYCDGSGKCTRCNGTGQIELTAGPEPGEEWHDTGDFVGYETCRECDGSGKCNRCVENGGLLCAECGGEGHFACDWNCEDGLMECYSCEGRGRYKK